MIFRGYVRLVRKNYGDRQDFQLHTYGLFVSR